MSSSLFPKQLALAALAGALWPAAWIALSPFLGHAGALEAHLLVVSACHVALLAGAGGRRPGVAFGLVLGLGGIALALAPGAREGLLALAGVMGACRALVSAGDVAPARALVREAALIGAGLLLARSVASPGLAGGALAIWAFGLVQSAWALLSAGATGARRPAGGGIDPFERSCAALRSLLGADPGTGGGGGRA